MISFFNWREGSAISLLAPIIVLGLSMISCKTGKNQEFPKRPISGPHLNHSAFFNKPFKTGVEVTKACLKCHDKQADHFLKTPHWQWLGKKEKIPGTNKVLRIGKKNLLNNFCLTVIGNWPTCTKCHAGYGWKDKNFDFKDKTHIDCLVCHDNSGTYAKGLSGHPRKGTDLLAAAKSVGHTTRQTCGSCHSYGGGGLAVKHGDLDDTLDNPDQYDDVHMSRGKFTCSSCHAGQHHNIKGKAISVSTNFNNNIGCTNCHSTKPHKNERLNDHVARVACQTCHIPYYANTRPTKMWWDWSKAGNGKRKKDHLHYLKIKGEFKYERHVIPEYYWFNGTTIRYLKGDVIKSAVLRTKGYVQLNHPMGDIHDKQAKIWPFKVHRATQPYDLKNRTLLLPLLSGKGGYWHEFNWPKALRLGAKASGVPFSGKYGFIKTEMYWHINHMVQPKERALRCVNCHGPQGRMNWSALGYPNDPMNAGVKP